MRLCKLLSRILNLFSFPLAHLLVNKKNELNQQADNKEIHRNSYIIYNSIDDDKPSIYNDDTKMYERAVRYRSTKHVFRHIENT